MRFLPFERLILRTDSPPEVVAAKLGSLVPGTFRGAVVGSHFQLVFTPPPAVAEKLPFTVVVGDVVPVSGGTEVRVTMRPDAFSSVTTSVLVGIFLFIIGMSLLAGLREGFATGGQDLGIAVTAALLVTVVAFINRSVGREIDKARGALRVRLGCPEVKP